MPADQAASLLELACAAAIDAGALLARQPGRPSVAATKSSPTDVVTEMDRAAEEQIRAQLLSARPGDAILGEEGGERGPGGEQPGPGGTPVRWIVDPLDGTVNYLYGRPDWSVSIAAEAAGTVVAGAVFAPRRGTLFTATLGGGAFARFGSASAPPQRLAANDGVPLDRALVATGFGYEASRRAVQGQVVAALLPQVRDIRRGGSCALDLCALASGEVDAYYERGVQAWDAAAGSLIAREAGATVAGLAGRPAGPELTVAAAGSLFDELSALLILLRPERDELG